MNISVFIGEEFRHAIMAYHYNLFRVIGVYRDRSYPVGDFQTVFVELHRVRIIIDSHILAENHLPYHNLAVYTRHFFHGVSLRVKVDNPAYRGFRSLPVIVGHCKSGVNNL